ncbi:hypothetical protein AMTRI_Chr06g191310 [Amborella trichopoda]
MLKSAAHQVAGHQATESQLGPVVDGHGLFYKPFQNNNRGSDEANFYFSLYSNPDIPKQILSFFPLFHGTKFLPASDGSGPQIHLAMEDLTFHLNRPSVLDLKIGSRTWFPKASEDYFRKCLSKDRETTTASLGFRVSGFQVFWGEELGFWKPDRDWVRGLTVIGAKMALERFVSSNCSDLDAKPDCKFAGSVYGGENGVLKKLLDLKAWFEEQVIYHFYSASVLIMYERDGVNGGIVKLIDFAHVIDGEGVIDHNFLGGLCSLIKCVSNILAASKENVNSDIGSKRI